MGCSGLWPEHSVRPRMKGRPLPEFDPDEDEEQARWDEEDGEVLAEVYG